MYTLRTPYASLALAAFIPYTFAVNITLTWFYDFQADLTIRGPVRAQCPNIPPGVCCKPHREVILREPGETLNLYMLSRIRVSDLLFDQFATGWGALRNGDAYENIACSGMPIFKVWGPALGEVEQRKPEPIGDYLQLNGQPKDMVFAASWVDLRTRFPPASADWRYLQWQGVKRFVWGGGRFSGNAASDGIPFPKREREVGKRLNGFAETGTVELVAPERWRYPSQYEINGTMYDKDVDGVFRSEDGEILDLKG